MIKERLCALKVSSMGELTDEGKQFLIVDLARRYPQLHSRPRRQPARTPNTRMPSITIVSSPSTRTPSASLSRLIAPLWQDGNGHISIDEQQAIERLFAELDTNGDGRMDPEETAAAMAKLKSSAVDALAEWEDVQVES